MPPMNLITRDTDYAVRALCYMAQRPKQVVSVTELCAELDMPRQYLRRILQMLARHQRNDILASYRGKGGGFQLRKDPAKILLTDLIEVFQGKTDFTRCAFRASVCPRQAGCSLRSKIKEIERKAVAELRATTIASLVAEQRSMRSGRQGVERTPEHRAE